MSTILIVDDEEPVRTILALLMNDAGYETIEAVNGVQALALLDRERPDLIISDIMMPLLSGVELSRRVRARDDARDVPIILMSAAGRRILEDTGADAFLLKPFDINELEALVARLLQARESDS